MHLPSLPTREGAAENSAVKSLRYAWVVGTCALAWFAPACATDLPVESASPKPPSVTDIGDIDPWQIRLRAVGILPQGDGHINGLPNSVTVGNSVIPELDFSYYFTRNFSIGALSCCVTYNAIYISNFAGPVAHTWVLPPTVGAQYHFTSFGAFQPYIGFGVNFAAYFDVHTTNYLQGTSLRIHNSWGVAGELGFDYMFNRHWGFNVDVKRIMMEPSFSDNGFGGLSGRAKINPWLIGVGLTYRFAGP
jgi:outer membrane protein